MFCKQLNNKGYSTLTNFVFLIIIGLVFFVVYNVLPFYYYYFELKNQMLALTKVANVNTDLEIKEKLFEQIKDLKIPADKDDIKIHRVDGEIVISVHYQEIFYVTIGKKDYDLYVFDFSAHVQNEILTI